MFTPEEAHVVKGALEGAVTYTRALEGLGVAMDGLTTAKRPALVQAARQMARAARDVVAGVLGLIGALPHELAAATRSEQLAFAWDGPPNGLTRATGGTLGDAAVALAPIDATLVSLVAQTQAALMAIDRAALLHSDPPPGGTFGGRRTMIGPHGDYYLAQHYAWSSIHYMCDWSEDAGVPILASVRLNHRAHVAGCWRLYAMIMRVAIQAAALNAGISLYTGWDNLPAVQGVRQFALTLAALGMQQRAVNMNDGEGLPELFSAHGATWLMVRPGVPAKDMPAWDRGMQRMLDAWRRNDNAGWMANFFPDRRAG